MAEASSTPPSTPTEPELECLAFEEPPTRSITAAEWIVIGVGLLTLVATLLALPRVPFESLIEAALVVVALILALWFVGSQAKRVAKSRQSARNYLRYLLWDRLLRVNSAALELVGCFYDDQLHPWAQSAPSAYYVGFSGDHVSLPHAPDLSVKDPQETDPANVRSVLGGRTIRSHGPLYRLDQIEVNGADLKLGFGPGCYADFVDTCESVAMETRGVLRQHWFRLLLRRAERHPETWLPEFYRSLFPQLSERKKRAGDRAALLDPDGKCLKLGINTVTILRDAAGAGYTFLLGKRSNTIVEYPGLYHVVPAGSFEPSKRAYFSDPLEFSVLGSVLREYFEECFVGEHKSDYDTNPPPLQSVVRQLGIRPIYDSRGDPARTEFKVTGVYFDYLSVKLEMTTCLVVHDSSYMAELERRRLLQSNWEYSGPLLRRPFGRSELESWISSDKMLTIGRLALQDAMRAFPQLLAPK